MAASPTPSRRLRPRHIALALGGFWAALTAAFGIGGTLAQFHDDSSVARPDFLNVPAPVKGIFYTLLTVTFLAVGYLFSLRVQNWERGQPDRRKTTKKNAKHRVEAFRSGVWMRTLLRDGAAGLMHSLIYFPFLVLFAVTNLVIFNELTPESLKFQHGTAYQALAFTADVAGVLFLVGIGWAIFRRYIQRVYRIRIKSRPEDMMILGTFAVIGVGGFLVEAFRIAIMGRPEFEKWSIVGYPLSRLFENNTHMLGWHQTFWILHALAFVTFLIILPTTKLRHMFTSPVNMYLSDRDRPKGAMKPLPNLEETSLETFGANVIEDFTWKQLMDTDACTVCGRCTSVCPAHATGKPLDPREIVLKVGHVMAATHPSGAVSPVVGQDEELTVSTGSVFERISSEEIWACTTCKACDDICPVNIEILDKILDMRRYLSLMESDFPAELGNMYRSLDNQQNPGGMNQSERGDWAKGLTGIDILDGSSPLDHEYL
ncbi:MAG: hypothetical protein QOF21_3024, partial [Actinomycetota bacterium]